VLLSGNDTADFNTAWRMYALVFPVIVGIHATKRRTANIIKVLPFEVIAAKHWP